jgi:hypothetical protein
MSIDSSESESDVVYDKWRNRHRKRCKTSDDKSLVIVESSAGAFKLQQKIGTGGGRPRDLEVPNAQLEAVSKMLSTHLESTATLLYQTQNLGHARACQSNTRIRSWSIGRELRNNLGRFLGLVKVNLD